MITLSTIAAVFSILISILVGGFIGWLTKGKNSGQFEQELEALKKANQSLEEEQKEGKKQLQKTEQQVDMWQQKFEALEREQLSGSGDLQMNYEQLEKKLALKTSEYDQLRKERDGVDNELEWFKKDQEKLKRKYNTDLASLKDMRANKEGLEKELYNYKQKARALEIKKDELTKLSEEQALKLKKDEAYFEGVIAKQKAEIKRLSEELEYWEKKHYDTHHALASAKKRIGLLEELNENLTALR